MLTPESRQAAFPSLADRTYLNTAAEGIPPQAVLDALAQYGQDKLLGMDGAKSKAAELVERCKAHLDGFGARADPLKGAADFVFERKS